MLCLIVIRSLHLELVLVKCLKSLPLVLGLVLSLSEVINELINLGVFDKRAILGRASSWERLLRLQLRAIEISVPLRGHLRPVDDVETLLEPGFIGLKIHYKWLNLLQ